jgi:outer membrane protein OmpA-like peptidoglycan-associated protein
MMDVRLFKVLNPQKMLLFAMPMFFAANCKDPCQKPFLNEQECKALDTDEAVEVIQPTAEIRVTDFQPDVVDAGVSFDATIYGKGFEEGAMVQVGDRSFSTSFVSETELNISANPMDSGMYNVTVSNPSSMKHTLYEALQVGSLIDSTLEECDDLTLYFELNKDSLTADSEQAIFDSSDCWMRNNVQLRLEGHCDERGTTEFNIALGQRRADSAKRFLLSKGIVDSNMKTVSHGEEKPAVQGSSESAYQQNRRVEIIVQ